MIVREKLQNMKLLVGRDFSLSILKTMLGGDKYPLVLDVKARANYA
jgi:hypothetical protein